MLSYTAAAILATSAFAIFEDPQFSGIPIDYSQGGDNWIGNCVNAETSQSQSPINFSKVTMSREMSFKIDGIEKWGLAYAPPTPLDNRASLIDYSYTMWIDGNTPDSQVAPWASETSMELSAPWPMGTRSTKQVWLSDLHSPSEHTFHDKNYDLEFYFGAGDGKNLD